MQSNNDAQLGYFLAEQGGRLPVEEFFAFHLSSRDCRAFCLSAQFVLARYRLRATIHITFFHPVYQKLEIPRFSFCRATFYPCFFFFSFMVYRRIIFRFSRFLYARMVQHSFFINHLHDKNLFLKVQICENFFSRF